MILEAVSSCCGSCRACFRRSLRLFQLLDAAEQHSVVAPACARQVGHFENGRSAARRCPRAQHSAELLGLREILFLGLIF